MKGCGPRRLLVSPPSASPSGSGSSVHRGTDRPPATSYVGHQTTPGRAALVSGGDHGRGRKGESVRWLATTDGGRVWRWGRSGADGTSCGGPWGPPQATSCVHPQQQE